MVWEHIRNYFDPLKIVKPWFMSYGMISFGNGSMFVQEKRRHVSVVLGAVFYICQLGQFDQLYCSDHLDPDRLLCPLVLSATEKYVLSCLTKRAVPFPLLSFSVWSPNLKYKLTVTATTCIAEIMYWKEDQIWGSFLPPRLRFRPHCSGCDFGPLDSGEIHWGLPGWSW